MPAVSQTLLVLMVVSWLGGLVVGTGDQTTKRPNTTHQTTSQHSPVPLVGVGLGVVTLAGVLTAALPVTVRHASSQIAESELMAGNLAAAGSAIQRARDSDPLSAEPWETLAGVHLLRWERGEGESHFASAVEAQRESIRRDPANANRYRMLGELWWRRYERTGAGADASAALSALHQAAQRYPHQASLWADLAEAAMAAGEGKSARDAAERALKLDALNRDAHHWDKVFSEERVGRLERLRVQGARLKVDGSS